VKKGSELKISFEGGTDTIGGNIVVVNAANRKFSSRYLFDFGVPMDAYRPQITLGSEPQTIDEFIRRGLISDFDMNFRACFLSHAHADHCVALPALFSSSKRPNAIWATKTTSRIVKKVQFVEKPLHADPFEKGDYYEDVVAKENGLDVKVALYPVDHDIPGACSYLAIVENTLIVYTGDFRDHGYLSEVIKRQFWNYAKMLQTKNHFSSCTVISEGTNFGLPFDFRSQSDFDNRMKEILGQYAKDLISVIVNQDGLWDIFSTIRSIRDQKVDRKIVVSKTLASFLASIRESFLEDYQRAVTSQGLLSFQEMMNPEQFIVYDPRKGSSVELLRKIAEKPSNYIIFLSRNEAFGALDKIAILSGQAGGCCVLSFSAYETNADSAIRTFAEGIGHIGFCVEKTNALARGHVSPHRLAGILNVIKPNTVFVMHTLAPEGLSAFLRSHLDCEIVAPTKGKQYEI
jgi:mRNA degradation ribonuclease J1/J2